MSSVYTTLTKKLTNSIVTVDAYQNENFIASYKDFTLKKKNLIIATIESECFEKANNYLVKLPHLAESIRLKAERRDDKCGLTMFMLPMKECKPMIALLEERESHTKWGDIVYMVDMNQGDLLTTRICPWNNLLLLECEVGKRSIGSPIINAGGNLIGTLVFSGHMSKKKTSRLSSIWTPASDSLKRLEQLRKISSRYLSFAIAAPNSNAVKFEANYSVLQECIDEMMSMQLH